MFRIRKLYDTTSKSNRQLIKDVQRLMLQLFPGETEKNEEIVHTLHNPLKYGFRTVVFVAEGLRSVLKGYVLMSHFPIIGFSYLDFMGVNRKYGGMGIGGALYSKVRQESVRLGCKGLFFECLPDDPKLCLNKKQLKENAARLNFYERYGARPIINTKYETPVNPKFPDNPPYLVFDDLDTNAVITREFAQKVARAILERKYRKLCDRDYNQMVIDSFCDDPVKLRDFRYKIQEEPLPGNIKDSQKVVLIVNEGHEIHHVQEKGYVEAPIRVGSILNGIEKTNLFKRIKRRHFSDSFITNIHDKEFVNYFKKICAHLPPDKSVYPYVFPIRNAVRKPKELDVRAGYYCIDTFTPLNANAYIAARNSVDCALTGAQKLLEEHTLVYALTRPPGHHAERRSFGGFCYFNATAIAANYLSRFGKIAILDIDFHHGNGQQNIFYERKDILTVSIHGHPHFSYPYFTGFSDEKGSDEGKGYNLNLPLREHTSYEKYKNVLIGALKSIRRFKPEYLVLALGFDTSKKDPTGTWDFVPKNFHETGRLIGRLKLPILVVQEGGYRNISLGSNAKKFFTGLWEGYYGK
jgi:acetoin utilization deacetylase AcuC-like enzyme/GNAT superfamily N-acetyltransferase